LNLGLASLLRTVLIANASSPRDVGCRLSRSSHVRNHHKGDEASNTGSLLPSSRKFGVYWNMPKNSFRLGVHPSCHYVSLFDAAEITIQPASGGQRRWPDVGVAAIGEGDLQFEILMPTEHERIPQRHVSTARSVLSQIVAMDNAARALPDVTDDDYDEVLAYVVISDDYVELHYFASTVNSEWGVYFTPSRQGDWDCCGFRCP
jgi:hypothetical protein